MAKTQKTPKTQKTKASLRNQLVNPDLNELRYCKLVPIIRQMIVTVDVDNVISHDDRALMTRDLSEFVVESIQKYEKGQKQHGGRLRDRALLNDMKEELHDLFHYLRTLKDVQVNGR